MATRRARGPATTTLASSAAYSGSAATSTLETEVERAREEANWKRVAELAEQLRIRQEGNRSCETLVYFLLGEAKLEDFLEEYPPKEKNVARAKEGLAEAKEYLLKTTGEEAKKLGVHLDSYILLGKLHYAMGQYSEALRFYDRAQIEALEEKQLPPRSLKIMAEAFAIRAICIEKTGAGGKTSRAKAAERDAAVAKAYEVAGDLTLLYLQVADKSSNVMQSTWSVVSSTGGGAGPASSSAGPAPISSSPVPPPIASVVQQQQQQPASAVGRLGPILEMAMLKAPMLNLKAGQPMKAIARFRAMLQAEETESLKDIRRVVCCRLAEVLLHGISDVNYRPPEPASASAVSSAVKHKSIMSAVSSDSPWKPKRHHGANLFVPNNKNEEAMLVLMLSELMARKEAILSQAPEFFDMRSAKFKEAIIAYDLTAVALARVRGGGGPCSAHRVLVEMLEHAMKFSFMDAHTWTQFALALSTEGKYFRSLLVLRELADRNQADAGSCLCAARMCFERLGLVDEGVEWAGRALKKDNASAEHALRARCNVYMGIGLILQSKSLESHSGRAALNSRARSHLTAAVAADPFDHLAEFHLALHLANARDAAAATHHARRALELHPEHQPSLHLLILLLSARGDMEEALEAADEALVEFPDSLPLMSLKVHLEERVRGPEAAILTTKGMLEQLQATTDQYTSDDSGLASAAVYNPGSSVIDPGMVNGSHTSAMAASTDALSDKDSVSLHAHSLTASHVERTLSEVASSLSAPFPKMPSGPQDASTVALLRIWLLASELQLRHHNLPEAEACLLEARNISPMSYHLMHARGRLHEARAAVMEDESAAYHVAHLEQARQCYENALGVCPSHVASLLGLARVLHSEPMCAHRLSVQKLKMAVRIDPYNEELWALLGQVKEALANEMLERADPCDSLAQSRRSETERTPTEETEATLLDEAARLFRKASECHAVALGLHQSSPVLPYSTVPVCFE